MSESDARSEAEQRERGEMTEPNAADVPAQELEQEELEQEGLGQESPSPSDRDDSPASSDTPASSDSASEPEEAVDDEHKKEWYILKVAFNREDSIRDALEKRVKLEGMEEYFGEIIVPTEDVVEFTRSGKRRITKRKLLPGYLMVHMAINDDTWFLVRETGGISDFTGSAGKPMPMDPVDIERFVKKPRGEDEEEAPMKTSIPFKPGDRVRVKEGNFQNQEGEVDSVDEANGRVTVIINIFGRSVPMELDHWQIEDL